MRKVIAKRLTESKVSMKMKWNDKLEWDLAEWSERCASIAKTTGLNPSGGSELTFRSDLLWLREVAVCERSLSLPVCCVTRVTHSALNA
jgi:hypothetical protein